MQAHAGARRRTQAHAGARRRTQAHAGARRHTQAHAGTLKWLNIIINYTSRHLLQKQKLSLASNDIILCRYLAYAEQALCDVAPTGEINVMNDA